jgi:hypothetical protein
MNKNCLLKLKNALEPEDYAKLETAIATNDSFLWQDTLIKARAVVSHSKYGAIIDSNIKKDLVDYINSSTKKQASVGRALLDIVSGSGTRQRSGRVSVDKYIEGVQGTYVSKLIDLIDQTRPTFMGLRRASNPEFIENIVKGIFGDADAKIPKGGQALIDAWHKVTKDILERFNRAGGNITELKGFNIPVNHMSTRLKAAGESTWISDAKKLFDLRKRADFKEISDDELLRKIYKNITSEGAVELQFEKVGELKGHKLGNSHQQFRQLQPVNGKAWLEYNKKYGRHVNPVESMKEYIASMATEIGLIEKLGTNPSKMINDLVVEAQRITGNPRTGEWAKASLDNIKARNPYADDWISNTSRGIRSLQTAIKLPISGITALSDISFITVRSMFDGLNPLKVFTRQISNLVTNKDYKVAARLGLLADYANQKAIAVSRFADSMGSSMLDRVADFAIRANGLNHWTNSAKATFGLEFLSSMADHSASKFDSLPPGLKRAFERYGFNDTSWDTIRKSKFTKDGVTFIDPMGEALDDVTKANLVGMIREEMTLAIPEPNAKMKALSTLGAPTNTAANELIKVGTQFKTFGISVMVSNFSMMLDKGLGVGTRLAYGTSLITTTTIMGVLISMLKDAAKGKTPKDITPKTVLEGFVQGGVGGPVADIFLNDPKMFGGVPGMIGGPTVGDLQRIITVMHGSYKEAMETGKAWENKLLPAIEKAGEELAFPLRLWYTRIAVERLMLDQVRRFTDPDYYSRLQRTEKWMRKQGQEYWSKPK